MEPVNPYAPPQATLTSSDPVPAGEQPLASRGARLAGAMIDGLISLPFGFALLMLTGTWDSMMQGIQPSFGVLVLQTAGGFAIFIALHGYFLARDGQTLGKRLVGTRIVSVDRRRLSLGHLLLLRYLPINILAMVPLGNFLILIDVLFIFGKERRCLHDRLAGTVVVKA